LGILREKGQKNFLEGFAREKYKYFKPPTGNATAKEVFIPFLCDNIWAF
jgi:hypothetical protein